MDECIGCMKNVIDGVYESFEITLNATSVNMKKEGTIAEHHYRVDEPYENIIETKEFRAVVNMERENSRNIQVELLVI